MKELRNELEKHRYFKWLLERIDGYDHMTLLSKLYNIPFTWDLCMDENRAMDGLALRERYLDTINESNEELPDDPCSVFEMLVGLASRMNDIMIGIGESDQTAYWFWVMIRNLKLEVMDDDNFYKYGGMDKLDDIIQDFLDRNYDDNGVGGLFPVLDSIENQRDIEIWYQMSMYLDENYSLNEGE